MQALITFIAVLFLNQVSAQGKIKIRDEVTYDKTKNFYILVDTFQTSMNGLILDPMHIQSLDVFGTKDALKKFGNQAKDGAIIIQIKKNVTLMRLNTYLDKFSALFSDDSLRKYRVCIDEKIVDKPELILIDESQLVAINTFNMVDFKNCQINNEKFLNLSTKRNQIANPQ